MGTVASLCFCAGASPPTKTTYNANMEMLASETGGAPSAVFGQWSIGYFTADGTDFQPAGAPIGNASVSGWGVGGAQESPYVWINKTGDAYSNGISIQTAKNAVGFHPGPNAEYAVLRWTAPKAGRVDIVTTFSNAVFNGTATTDVHVILNQAKHLADGEIKEGTPSVDASKSNVQVMANDTIDLLVGTGANGYRSDITGVFHTITYVP
jgi:hypothetical protein